MTIVTTQTDNLSEIVSKYNYDGEALQLNDLDSWDLEDLHEALAILDNEVAERCNREIDGNF